MRILGLSAWYHDAAACLVEDGLIVAAAQEERFSRIKHDAGFPRQAIRACLDASRGGAVDAVAFYEKPLLKFHRILSTQLAMAPRGLRPFLRATPLWLREKLWIPDRIERELAALGVRTPEGREPPLYFPEHHLSHAASAFYPSPFDAAAVLTLDGVGEWATTTIGHGHGRELRLLAELRYPHSLGMLYSAFTQFLGFRVNSGEYKLMGLAPYGEPRYRERILERLVDLREDGSFRLRLEAFAYLDSLAMTDARFAALFDGPARAPEAPFTRRDLDLARSIQEVTEEIVLRMAAHACELTGERRLCLAGGVALNCVANGRLLRSGLVEDLWIQPAAGDAGGALGAALAVWHGALGEPRPDSDGRDGMGAALLGPAWSPAEIREFLRAEERDFEVLAAEYWPERLAELLAGGAVIGLFQGRMEFGPRALGNRSILADPRRPEMQSQVNLRVKFREGFRPFAPIVPVEDAAQHFELDRPSPYMLLVTQVRTGRQAVEPVADPTDLVTRVQQRRSAIPAVTHVDGSARVQTVAAEDHPRLHRLLRSFGRHSGIPVLLNTSFNLRGEPIVCSPADALACFDRSGLDALVLEDCLLRRRPDTPGNGAPEADGSA